LSTWGNRAKLLVRTKMVERLSVQLNADPAWRMATGLTRASAIALLKMSTRFLILTSLIPSVRLKA